MRYERKYRITGADYFEVLSIVRGCAAGFRTAFPDRRIHNIYLDTHDLQFLRDNLNGHGERMKARIRWYGTQAINSPNLEYKIRHNGLGTKTSRVLPAPDSASSEALRLWLREHLQDDRSLVPVLYNSYLRSYLLSWDGRFRLTLDRELCFSPPQVYAAVPPVRSDAVIIEVKYAAAHDAAFDGIGQYLPWILTKNSKYVEGMGLV